MSSGSSSPVAQREREASDAGLIQTPPSSIEFPSLGEKFYD